MKKGLISIGLICMSIPIVSSETLVGVLMSQDTDSVMIDGRTFKGDSITSLIIAPKFSNSKFGGYLSVGGTFGRSEDKRQSDEENKDFKNNMSYRVVNLGVTYSPISNVTFLGGAGYAQSEGRYYHNIRYDNRNRVKFDTSHTEKDRGINYNAGLNFSYKDWGIITMYDTYPKVFSVGISYNYKPVKPRPKPRPKPKSSDSGLGNILGAIFLNGLVQGAKNIDKHERKVNALSREDRRKYNACNIKCDGEISEKRRGACRDSCYARWID